jgi:hypothetical protein
MKLKQQLSLGLLFIMLSACGGDSTNNTDAVNESINLEKNVTLHLSSYLKNYKLTCT